MLLVPQSDPAKAWQLQIVGGRDELWQLPADIFFYAVDKQDLRTRGESYTIARYDAAKATKSIKLARLQYEGNWDPEPGGWRRLANLLHNREKLDVELTNVKIDVPGASLADERLAQSDRNRADQAERGRAGGDQAASSNPAARCWSMPPAGRESSPSRWKRSCRKYSADTSWLRCRRITQFFPQVDLP